MENYLVNVDKINPKSLNIKKRFGVDLQQFWNP